MFTSLEMLLKEIPSEVLVITLEEERAPASLNGYVCIGTLGQYTQILSCSNETRICFPGLVFVLIFLKC